VSEPRVLLPLPDHDFDVTEVAVPWRLLTRSGYRVEFATENGATPAADPLLLSGVIFGELGAKPEPKAFYHELEGTPAFQKPIAWRDVVASDYAGLLLPGGHAQGVRQYLESTTLFDRVAAFWKLRRPVAAICHGVLVLARTIDPSNGKSVLWKQRTTCLPKYMERTAFYLTSWKHGRYYRTYDAYVEDEVRAALSDPSEQFERGPISLIRHGTATDDGPAFVAQDDHYVSARWPGDAYRFARAFIGKLAASPS
jgi:putative intracellular protease/amidase